MLCYGYQRARTTSVTNSQWKSQFFSYARYRNEVRYYIKNNFKFAVTVLFIFIFPPEVSEDRLIQLLTIINLHVQMVFDSTNTWLITLHILRRKTRRWLSWLRRPTGDQEVAGSTTCPGRQHSFVEIDHEIFSTVILSLLLIQEGQLSDSGKRMCTILVNHFED